MTSLEQDVTTLRINKTEVIAAPPKLVWEAILHELGPDSDLNPGTQMNFKFEPFPGGRWYRDLGDGVGHLWAHVQVIKPNKLLELCGPMFMSYAAQSHVQYKLIPEGTTTRLEFVHTAFGLIPPEVAENVQAGWGRQMETIRTLAQRSRR